MRRWLRYIPAGFMPFLYEYLIVYAFFVKDFREQINGNHTKKGRAGEDSALEKSLGGKS
jgi:hypothetical protein